MAQNSRAARGGGVATSLTAASLGVSTSSDQNAGIVQGTGADWFGPGNPMRPVAPPEVAGRGFDFPVAYNLNQRPRAYEPITFETLRLLSNSFDILRLAIETRKDQVAGEEWVIPPIDEKV